MKTLCHLLIATGILALGAGMPVFAQDQHRVTVTATVPVLMQLSIQSGTTVAFVFEQNDYIAGGTGSKEMVDATTFAVAANARWKLEVGAETQEFQYTAGPNGAATNPHKNCSDLSLKTGTDATYTPVTLINRTLVEGEPGANTAPNNVIPVSYKLDTTLTDDPPGSYVLTLSYTLLPL